MPAIPAPDGLLIVDEVLEVVQQRIETVPWFSTTTTTQQTHRKLKLPTARLRHQPAQMDGSQNETVICNWSTHQSMTKKSKHERKLSPRPKRRSARRELKRRRQKSCDTPREFAMCIPHLLQDQAVLRLSHRLHIRSTYTIHLSKLCGVEASWSDNQVRLATNLLFITYWLTYQTTRKTQMPHRRKWSLEVSPSFAARKATFIVSALWWLRGAYSTPRYNQKNTLQLKIHIGNRAK